MKRCEVGETIKHYIPEFYNDLTGKWTDIECRIRVETYAATAVDYVDVKLA